MAEIIKRKLGEPFLTLSKYFPVLSLEGPRQAGKSTFLKDLFPNYTYVSLEDPDIRDNAVRDPRGFFKTYNEYVIFDEAQKFPDLFSYIQTIVDKDRKPARYILSGSQNLVLNEKISQSLAGRVGSMTLYPFSKDEVESLDVNKTWKEACLGGFYPGKIVNDIPSNIFYKNYVRTYIERDVKDLVNASNISIFRKFIKLSANYAGQILNYTSLSNDLDVSVNTIKSWLSILEMCYIIHLLPVHHKNFGKRIIKSPKLYFLDTGLLCYLLDIEDEDELFHSDKIGAVYENLIIAEYIKHKCHNDKRYDLSYFRDSNGLEIDLIKAEKKNLEFIEIKASYTFKDKHTENLYKLKALDDKIKMKVIYGGETTMKYKDVEVGNWDKFL